MTLNKGLNNILSKLGFKGITQRDTLEGINQKYIDVIF